MLALETAQERILATIQPLGGETIPLDQALGRFAAARIVAPRDLPGFDNSAMDGYAVRSADVAPAQPDRPVTLRLLGRVAAGEMFTGELAGGTCIRLFTGSAVPRGADAVVMQEDTRVDPTRPETVQMLEPVKPWENIRFHGEDFKQSAVVVNAGERFGVGRVALLAALGLQEVCAGRLPVVGLLATGSELREAGQPLAPGQIYESNRAALAALVSQSGAVPKLFPLVPDTADGTRTALTDAFATCDVVVTSGGVSVGELDFVKSAFRDLGGELEFWQVAIKPGKPFAFGRWQGKCLFGLPGNPVSALVTFWMLARPALLRLQGAAEAAWPSHPGVLAETLVNRSERRHFVRVSLDASGQVHSSGAQASHILSALAAANGLVDVPPHATLAAGSTVPVLRWD